MRFSVIMPMERAGGDGDRAVRAVLEQSHPDFELIIVGAQKPPLPDDERVRWIEVTDRNPALRRNRAAAAATGDVLAFIDDDAFASRDWLAVANQFLTQNPDVLALGGPDPAPSDSDLSELISDTLLSTPFIGSGVLCHENRPGTIDVKNPHDVALVNLFVRKDAFRAAGGFDEGIGYIGEDTALVETLLRQGKVAYHSAVVVHHRRRSFPEAYLRQRWRYRVKTGRMLVTGGSRYRTLKIVAFLAVGFLFALLVLMNFAFALPLLAAYAVGTLVLAAPTTRLPIYLWPAIPIFFFMHHATYFAGIVMGALSALAGKR